MYIILYLNYKRVEYIYVFGMFYKKAIKKNYKLTYHKSIKLKPLLLDYYYY